MDQPTTQPSPDGIADRVRTRRDRATLEAHARASGVPIDGDDEPRDWAAVLAATPPGHVTLNTPQGPVTRPIGSASPGQIASLQASQTEYGDRIQWHLTMDDASPIREGRPGKLTLAWTHADSGQLSVTTWNTEGKITAEGRAGRG